ncbi:MAG: choice-of-anchor D domain-containing protein [Bacteroidetes bacterium]|nr:choice-of-anchor D domain-containing protein [Bacteroidota bacterium]
MNTRYIYLPLVIGLLLLACLAPTVQTVHAQPSPNGYAARVNNYGLVSFTGGYTEISSTGTPLYQYCGSYSYSYGNNVGSISMPFAFNYDSVNYAAGSPLYVRWDNTVGFSQNYNANYDGTGIQTGSFPNQIMIWNQAYMAFQGCSYPYSGVYYQTVGTAPNRSLIVEYYNIAYYGYYGYYYGYTVSEEVKLYEANNNIELLYSSNNRYMYYCYKGSIGLCGNSSPTYVYNAAQTTTSYNFGTWYTPTNNIRFVCPLINYNRNMSATPKVVNFSNTMVGTLSTANITIKHVGTEQNLAIQSTTLAGSADFSILSAPTSLSPGQSGTLTVQFKPTIFGSQTATLTIVSNGRDSGTQSIVLNGTGLAPLIVVDTNILFKKTLTKMGQGSTKRLLISNTGTGAMIWNSFTFTGIDADQYSIAQYPTNNPIPIGTTDSVFVTYTPTREGRHTSTMYINTNALNNPSVPIQLIGTGILPHIVVTPSVIRFDSTYEGDTARQSLTVYNPGSDTLIIKQNMLVSNDADFSINVLTGTDAIIPPDKSRTMTVTFVPKQMGARQGRYVLKTNIIPTFEQPSRDTAGTITVDFAGTGVPFGVLAQSIGGATYDTTIKGTQVCRMDTLMNNGDADIMLTGWNISGSNAADFSASGITFPYLLKARSSVVVNICGTPSDFGLHSAKLTVNGTSNKKAVAVNVTLNVYGLKVCASADPSGLFTGEYVLENTDSSECVTVTNCGELAAVYTVKLSNNADYSVTPSQSASIPAGGATTFCVKFHPAAYGASNASLTVSTPNVNDIVVPITGIGACANVSAPQPAIAPTGKDGHQPFSVTITNAGNYTWTPGTETITPNDGVFLITGFTPVAGNNGQVVVNGTFNPTDLNKTYSAQVTFPQAAPACASALTINLSAQSTSASVPTVVEQAGFSLGQNYPNPFAASTSFSYTTPTEAPVSITICDLTGHLVSTIANGRVSAGEHLVSFDASELASGTYVISLKSGSISLARQIVVTK